MGCRCRRAARSRRSIPRPTRSSPISATTPPRSPTSSRRRRPAASPSIAGAADHTGWCPIDPVTFESKLGAQYPRHRRRLYRRRHAEIGFRANAQAKACAGAVATLLAGERPPTPKLIGACYSLVAPDYAYLGCRRLRSRRTACSPTSKAPAASARSTRRASSARAKPTMPQSWFATITAEVFG